MLTPSEFGAELKQATDGRSIRRLADQSGWGRSTIHEWLTGVRIPSAAQMNDLLDVVEASAETRATLHYQRSLVADDGAVDTSAERLSVATSAAPSDILRADGPDAPPDTPDIPPDVPDAPPAGESTVGSGGAGGSTGAEPTAAQALSLPLSKLLVVAVAVLAIAAAGFGGGYYFGARMVPPGPPDTFSATVNDTGGKGVFQRGTPTQNGDERGSLEMGDTVNVICLIPNGDEVFAESQNRSSRVWALLSDGTWVTDLYLDTDKSWSYPSPPPAPMKLCGNN